MTVVIQVYINLKLLLLERITFIVFLVLLVFLVWNRIVQYLCIEKILMIKKNKAFKNRYCICLPSSVFVFSAFG